MMIGRDTKSFRIRVLSSSCTLSARVRGCGAMIVRLRYDCMCYLTWRSILRDVDGSFKATANKEI